ncbi:tetratricopeptide repeat protein [Trichlorobacter lovleyi]|uniref:tetratricopeptide repeat protein n=1 Tax=Trichlorobacter lovleyi TaxID=313985 RepID=UPI002240826C|nr:tetratricopeptide repeat protein [Trichlorobacter lovleyi]QOX80283.1 tetratricopeptide repeat protein [Trichlorobacter lovleyi]
MPIAFRLITELLLCRGLHGSAAGLLCLFLALILFPQCADASIQNLIHRIEIRPKSSFTRITVKLAEEPHFRVSRIPGNRLRIRFSDTSGAPFRSLRRYSDANIGGVLVSQRGNDALLTFAIAANRVGWRMVHVDGLPALSLDVGPLFSGVTAHPALPGRERIRNGAAKLLSNFDPPLKPEIPFVPTDRNVLKTLLPEDEQRLFLAAEGALYKGKLTAAEDAFAPFATRPSRIRPLALYRLAEAQYRLQKYGPALETFREAARQWQDFLTLNPAIMFYYGDSIARSGDLPGGRQLLARLIVSNADKKYAPVLLVRMADVLARQGGEGDALAIYNNISTAFKDNKAHQIAVMKLADRAFLEATPDDYQALGATYAKIAANTTDFDLREETTFKHALLEAINGPADTALDLAITYQKRFPTGVYSTVIRDIREDLVALVFQGTPWDKNPAGLIRLVTDNQEYLATAVKNPVFLPAVSGAFEKAGRPLDLIALYSGLLERPWVGADNIPYLTLQVADQAELLGDTLMARRVLQGFLLRNPAHAQTRWAHERLGAIQFAAHELPAVRVGLSWLLNKQESATFPVSYYYLGRALWDNKEYARSAQAMELYLYAVKDMKEVPVLVGDAYYIAASSRQVLGERKAAAVLLEAGLKAASKERKEQFLYKLGELAALDGRSQQARALFERVLNEGRDPDWQRLARQALEDDKLSRPAVAPSKKK